MAFDPGQESMPMAPPGRLNTYNKGKGEFFLKFPLNFQSAEPSSACRQDGAKTNPVSRNVLEARRPSKRRQGPCGVNTQIRTNSLLCLGYILQTVLGMIYFDPIKKQSASPANDSQGVRQ